MQMNAKHRFAQFAAQVIAKALPPRLLYSPRNFEIWESRGYHIVRADCESPIPPTSELPEELWERPSKMVGIDMRDACQASLLDTLSSQFKHEYDAFPRGGAPGDPYFHLNNGWFEKVDAEMLYAIVRYLRPARIIEIGSGITTILSAAAISKNREEDPDYRCDFTAVEPNPVRLVPESLPRNFEVVQSRAQLVSLDVFRQLSPGDILFIDSSHVARAGSDVNFEIFEILPNLVPGVWIHFHDIFLPWEYPRSWILGTRRFLNEQYLLQAFLSFNTHFEVVWGSYYMLQTRPKLLENAFASFKEDITPPGTFLPGSFWIRRVA
jgi:hypothetical protein